MCDHLWIHEAPFNTKESSVVALKGSGWGRGLQFRLASWELILVLSSYQVTYNKNRFITKMVSKWGCKHIKIVLKVYEWNLMIRQEARGEQQDQFLGIFQIIKNHMFPSKNSSEIASKASGKQFALLSPILNWKQEAARKVMPHWITITLVNQALVLTSIGLSSQRALNFTSRKNWSKIVCFCSK